MIAFGVDCVGDILSFSLRRYSYLLALSFGIGVSSGLTPIVYIIGGWDRMVTRARTSDQQEHHKFSIVRLLIKKD